MFSRRQATFPEMDRALSLSYWLAQSLFFSGNDDISQANVMERYYRRERNGGFGTLFKITTNVFQSLWPLNKTRRRHA